MPSRRASSDAYQGVGSKTALTHSAYIAYSATMRQNEIHAYTNVAKTADVIRIRRSNSGLTSNLLAKLEKGNEQLLKSSSRLSKGSLSRLHSGHTGEDWKHDLSHSVSPALEFEAEPTNSNEPLETQRPIAHQRVSVNGIYTSERDCAYQPSQTNVSQGQESLGQCERHVSPRRGAGERTLNRLNSLPSDNLEKGPTERTDMRVARVRSNNIEYSFSAIGKTSPPESTKPLCRRASEIHKSRLANRLTGLDPKVEDYYLGIDSPECEKSQIHRQPITMSQYVKQHTNNALSDANIYSNGRHNQCEVANQNFSSSQTHSKSQPLFGQSTSRIPLTRRRGEDRFNDYQSSQTSFVPMTIHSPNAGRNWVQPNTPPSASPRKTLMRRASAYCSRRSTAKRSQDLSGDDSREWFSPDPRPYQDAAPVPAERKDNRVQRNRLQRRASDTTALKAKTGRMRLATSHSAENSFLATSEDVQSLDTVDKRWKDLSSARPFDNGASNRKVARRASESDKRLGAKGKALARKRSTHSTPESTLNTVEDPAQKESKFIPKSMDKLKRFARRASSSSSLKSASKKTLDGAKSLMRISSRVEVVENHTSDNAETQEESTEQDTTADVPSMIFIAGDECPGTDVRRLRRRLSERNMYRNTLRVDRAKAKAQFLLQSGEDSDRASEPADEPDEVAPDLICVHVADEKTGGRTTKKVYYQRAKSSDFESYGDRDEGIQAVELSRLEEDGGFGLGLDETTTPSRAYNRPRSSEAVFEHSKESVLEGNSINGLVSASVLVAKARPPRHQLKDTFRHSTRQYSNDRERPIPRARASCRIPRNATLGEDVSRNSLRVSRSTNNSNEMGNRYTGHFSKLSSSTTETVGSSDMMYGLSKSGSQTPTNSLLCETPTTGLSIVGRERMPDVCESNISNDLQTRRSPYRDPEAKINEMSTIRPIRPLTRRSSVPNVRHTTRGQAVVV